MKAVSKRMTFTMAELREMRRALLLIMQEDESCAVNMDLASVAAKASALRKLTAQTGRSLQEIALDGAESVRLDQLSGKDRPFTFPKK